MTNATLQKFGYPASLIHEYEQWAVLLRPKQLTLGALVLICKNGATAFADVGGAAFAELQHVTRDIEAALKTIFQYDKLNYIMLMMVDPDVHFHILPRYGTERDFAGLTFTDASWPGPPDFARENKCDTAARSAMLTALQQTWNK